MQSLLGSLFGFGPKKELHNLEGRVAVITGGSQGIGSAFVPPFFLQQISVMKLGHNVMEIC